MMNKKSLPKRCQNVVANDRPAQSLKSPWGQASRLQRCSVSAATEQDLCKTVTATSPTLIATSAVK
jgi:hypothetical protein